MSEVAELDRWGCATTDRGPPPRQRQTYAPHVGGYGNRQRFQAAGRGGGPWSSCWCDGPDPWSVTQIGCDTQQMAIYTHNGLETAKVDKTSHRQKAIFHPTLTQKVWCGENAYVEWLWRPDIRDRFERRRGLVGHGFVVDDPKDHAASAQALPQAAATSHRALGHNATNEPISAAAGCRESAYDGVQGLWKVPRHYAAASGLACARASAQVASSVNVATRAAANAFQYAPGIEPSLVGRRIHDLTVASETGRFASRRTDRTRATVASWMILL